MSNVLAGDIESGLATLLPMTSSSIWLTSEFALDLFLRFPASSRSGSLGWLVMVSSPSSIGSSFSSDGGVHVSLMSSVKSDRMENSEDRVPPVETSLSR